MTEVRIRHEFDSESALLADVPFDKLDTVIPTIQTWGISDEQPELVGQFVYGDARAYFEVIICARGGAA